MGSPQTYGTDLGSAGNYISDISSVPGLAGLFAASREARQHILECREGEEMGSGREAASQRMLVGLEEWV